MKVELRDGSFDYAQLEHLAQAIAERASAQSMFQVARNSFRADAPQLNVVIDRVKSETLGVPLGNALDTLSSYVGSSYVSQFNKFGRVFQIYVQAEAAARMQPGVAAVRCRCATTTAAWCRSARWPKSATSAGPR